MEITDNRPRYALNRNETRLLAASEIMSGLLASGHYTENYQDEAQAVKDALTLLNELEIGLKTKQIARSRTRRKCLTRHDP